MIRVRDLDRRIAALEEEMRLVYRVLDGQSERIQALEARLPKPRAPRVAKPPAKPTKVNRGK